MHTIINLTQHSATKEQHEEGVIDLTPEFQSKLKSLLTFNNLPTSVEIKSRADEIYALIVEFVTSDNSPIKDEAEGLIDEDGLVNESEFFRLKLKFMLGGAPYLMRPLVNELSYLGECVFAFSKRDSVEVIEPDGSVTKKTIFKHAGFVPAC